jgi:hypothetical protein
MKKSCKTTGMGHIPDLSRLSVEGLHNLIRQLFCDGANPIRADSGAGRAVEQQELQQATDIRMD